MDNVEFIKLGRDRHETEMRLLQKIEFGKEIIPFGFFKEQKITDIEVLSVYQFDPNTRFTIIENCLLKITADNSIYNYIDKDRKVLVYTYVSYSEEDIEEKLYIFNDLDISEKDLKLFNDFNGKRQLKLKKIGLLNKLHCYLVFKEDIDIVKERIKAQREEERLEKEKERAEVLEERTGFKAIELEITDQEQLDKYDLIVLAVDNNKVRQVVYNSGVKFLDLRASGKTFMAYLTEKDDTEYLNLTVDDNIKGGCQRAEDLEDRHIQFGNKIIAEIGIQVLADYLRGEIKTKKVILTL